MDILKRYAKVFELYKAKDFKAALKNLDKLKAAAPHLNKPFLLEALIIEEQGDWIKSLALLKKLLPRLNDSSPEEKILAAGTFNLLGTVNRYLGLMEDSLKAFCMAARLESDKGLACKNISNALLAACALENFSVDDFQALYSEYKNYLTNITLYPKKFYANDKIRLGFLSANFKWSVVMSWSWALIRDIDRNLFKVYCYSNVQAADEVTDYFRANVDVWHDIHDMTDEAAAKVIRDDEIDILFDLDGHTENNRLPVATYHPASVQVSGIGYMNSTGLECFDYFLTDVHCAGDKKFFTEKLIALPHSHICYEPSIKNTKPADTAPCLKKGYVTFGSFNQYAKITDSILIAWKKILDAVPLSRLLLKHKIFDNKSGRNYVSKRLTNLGFNLARVEMRGFSKYNHLLEYGDVDIALDTFPYTGGVTTCEALYMGVPVVSLYGDRHSTRFGLSILSNVGLGELAVNSYEDYVGRAVMIASDWELLDLLRKNLRTMMTKSPLMDAAAYVKEVEQAFIKILDETQ